ncbi:olfactory receptor 2T3-like [Elephas maximus indicus]|uniref:olfactory receptor 2T3-like n=1 Tax=Elephas maximus indicus TaxID=99487 RepID=UPI0021162F32|nr:olfactory receptor 2T3-like [Elephas maximus indicus]
MYSGNQTSENQTLSTYFILMGLFDQTKYAVFLYTLTFVLFLMALTGNALLILLIHREPRLHTPMYFFISQLSLIDLMYVCATVPKMLVDQVTGDNTISHLGCGVQMFSYLTLAGAEVFLLSAMAYDLYAAICRPLHYPLLMNQRVCHLFMSGCWFLGMSDGLLLTAMTMSLPFCQFRKIMNFFCEAPTLLKLSCSNIPLYETFMYLCCILMILIPIISVSGSYVLILRLIHSINSAEGRRKAFATCSSHMVVVLLFFGASIYTNMLPRSYHTGKQDMTVSAFYTIITPVLNSFIYSLWNKDVTGALRNLMLSGMGPRKF